MNLGNWGHLFGVVTIILMIVFLGIWYWAWRPRHRKTFERPATMPLEDLKHDKPDAGAHGHAKRGRTDARSGLAQDGDGKQESQRESKG